MWFRQESAMDAKSIEYEVDKGLDTNLLPSYQHIEYLLASREKVGTLQWTDVATLTLTINPVKELPIIKRKTTGYYATPKIIRHSQHQSWSIPDKNVLPDFIHNLRSQFSVYRKYNGELMKSEIKPEGNNHWSPEGGILPEGAFYQKIDPVS